MKFNLFMSLTSLIALLACSPSFLSSKLTTPGPVTPISSLETSGPISTATDALPTFQVENLDPRNRVVELSELDLNPRTRILVFDPKTEQFFSISNRSIDLLPNMRPEMSLQLDTIRLSPDHQWFAYLEINNGFNIWIGSVGDSQHFVGIGNAVGSSFRWISNEKIAVYNKLGGWADCPSEMQIFDPFSKEINDIPDFSSEGIAYCFPIPYFSPDFSQGLYLDSDIGWKIYDYNAQISFSALPGLDTSPGGNKYFFQWGKEGLSFAIPHPDKISFASNLSKGEFSSSLHIRTISLPEDSLNENGFFEIWVPEEQLAGFDLVGRGKKNLLDCDIPQSFVVVNLVTQKLNNYCLNRSVFSNQSVGVWFTYISADHRFAGWIINSLPSNSEPLGSVILDLETGKVSYLEGYEFLGFGEVNP